MNSSISAWRRATSSAFTDAAPTAPRRRRRPSSRRARRALRGGAGLRRLGLAGGAAPLRAALLVHGDRVAIEEPGYPGARAALRRQRRASSCPVPVDAEGLMRRRAPALGRGVRAVYVTPSHQYPLGMSMSAARRLALLDWAARARRLDARGRLRQRVPLRQPPARRAAGHGRATSAWSTSAPSARCSSPRCASATSSCRRAWATRSSTARDAFDIFSPTLYQLALADFLREGHFARHLRRMRGVTSDGATRCSPASRGTARGCSRCTTRTPGCT